MFPTMQIPKGMGITNTISRAELAAIAAAVTHGYSYIAKKLGLDSQRVKKLASKLHVHSVNFAAKLVHTRLALSRTIINSHQEPLSGQACNPLDPHWFSLPFSRWRSFTVLGTKVAPFPWLMWGVVFTACVVLFSCLGQSTLQLFAQKHACYKFVEIYTYITKKLHAYMHNVFLVLGLLQHRRWTRVQ